MDDGAGRWMNAVPEKMKGGAMELKKQHFQVSFNILLAESILPCDPLSLFLSTLPSSRKNYYNNNFSPSLPIPPLWLSGWRLAIVFTAKSLLQVLCTLWPSTGRAATVLGWWMQLQQQHQQHQLNLFWLSGRSVLNEIKY